MNARSDLDIEFREVSISLFELAQDGSPLACSHMTALQVPAVKHTCQTNDTNCFVWTCWTTGISTWICLLLLVLTLCSLDNLIEHLFVKLVCRLVIKCFNQDRALSWWQNRHIGHRSRRSCPALHNILNLLKPCLECCLICFYPASLTEDLHLLSRAYLPDPHPVFVMRLMSRRERTLIPQHRRMRALSSWISHSWADSTCAQNRRGQLRRVYSLMLAPVTQALGPYILAWK